MPYLLLGLLGAALVFLKGKVTLNSIITSATLPVPSDSGTTDKTPNATDRTYAEDAPDINVNSFQNSLGLTDIDPMNQGGSYDRSFDSSLQAASKQTGVPFAVLKAHAIRESNLDPRAYRQEPSGKASYGLMQVLWWQNSNRFANYGWNDDYIGDGTPLYDPDVNSNIGAKIWLGNWKTYGNLRDAINAYNTGRDEATRPAPGNYVNDVIKYYSDIVKESVF